MKEKKDNKTKSINSNNKPPPQETYVIVNTNHNNEEDCVIIHKNISGYSNIVNLGGGIFASDGGLYSDF